MAEFFATYYVRQRAIEKIKEAGAISKETAKASKELGIDESTLKWLAFVKDVKKTKDGRFYVPCEEGK